MTNREKYLSILSKVPNTEQLIEWLATTDFFTAPASTKFHSSYEGGLCYHSLAVYDCLKDSVIADTFSEQTLIKVALLHDLCKANFYTVDYRNAKIDGQWERVPFYAVKDDFPYGHGEKSVLLASRFLRLSEEELRLEEKRKERVFLALFLRQLVFEPQIIGDHRDKLRVGRLAAVVLDGVAEIGIEHVHVPAVPGHLNGVADGTLHA